MIQFNMPAGVAEQRRPLADLLSRRHGLIEADNRLSREGLAAAEAVRDAHNRLDGVEADRAVADAAGDDKRFRELNAARSKLRHEIAESEDTAAQKERARRGLAVQLRELDQAINNALPEARLALGAVRDAWLTALSAEYDRALRGEGSLIFALRASYMSHATLGVPGREFLDQVRIPDPRAPVVALSSIVGAGGYSLGEDVKANWLLHGGRASPWSRAPVETLAFWQADKNLVSLSEQFKPYADAVAEADKIMRLLQRTASVTSATPQTAPSQPARRSRLLRMFG